MITSASSAPRVDHADAFAASRIDPFGRIAPLHTQASSMGGALSSAGRGIAFCIEEAPACWYKQSSCSSGGVAEWFMAPVLKTGVPKGTGGSNPSPSAIRRIRCAHWLMAGQRPYAANAEIALSKET
jgi:hypothetical protein